MNRFILLPLALLVLFITTSTFSQTLHIVETTSLPNTFIPSMLTIVVGDTVRWNNVSQGFHNVVADDNSFTSGPPSTSLWVYEFVFTTVGVNPYYCVSHGSPGGLGMSGVITVENATGVNDDNITVEDFELKQNFPNPFNPSTKISFVIPVSGIVKLKIYNILGIEIATLVNEEKPAGSYEVEFSTINGFLPTGRHSASDGNAANLSSGIYYYSLTVNGNTKTKKMVLIK